MVNPISNLAPAQPLAPLAPLHAPQSPVSGGKGFSTILAENLGEVQRLQDEAERSVERLLTGQSDDVNEVLTAANKAGIAFDLLMEVRNKLVRAYEEIQQMRV